MREDLKAQLDQWHEEDNFDEIVNAVMEVPEGERDYELTSHLGRALNNLGRYDEAIEQFLTIAEEGKDDALWHYRIGLAYYYENQYEDALRAFEMADKLDPGDEDTMEFLDEIRSKLSDEQQPVEEPIDQESVTEPATGAVSDLDLADFWDDSEHALEQYVCDPPSDELIESVEEALVFKLPTSYIQMMKVHNGGVPKNTSFPIAGEERVVISGMLGIGREKSHSLCGDRGSRYRIEHEGYPEFGVIIAECSTPDEVIMLDYRPSGNDGEPEVVHVDKANGYKITRLAPNFEAFVRGLV